MGNLPETAPAVGLADNENGAGTGADPGIFAGEISMDTGLADASDSALTGDNPMAEAGAAVSESLVLDFADTDKLSWPVTEISFLATAWTPRPTSRLWTSTKSTPPM